jgi:hypothetical protein
MNVEIRRKWETDLSVCGEMWIDGQFECLTLEPSRLTPIHADHPCIAAGGRFRWTFTCNTSGNWDALIFGLRPTTIGTAPSAGGGRRKKGVF